MKMKKVVFVCHDPGGFDVIQPVYEALKKEMTTCEFFPVGPSKRMAGYGIDEVALLRILKNMLSNNEVDMLVTGTSWGTDIEVKCLEMCNSCGVKTVAILDYWSNYRMRFKYMDYEKYVFPDKLFVMDEIAYEEAIADGIDKSILEITGSPGLDKLVDLTDKKRKSEAERNGDILFLSDPLSDLYGGSLGYTEESVLEDILEICQSLGRDVKVKFHPKDNDRMRKKYAYLEVVGNIDDILPDYKIAISMVTMGLLHAYLLGIPIISYQPKLVGKDMCITNRLGITKRVDSKILLETILTKGYVDSNVIEDKHIWEDGQSTCRVCNRLKEILIGGT